MDDREEIVSSLISLSETLCERAMELQENPKGINNCLAVN